MAHCFCFFLPLPFTLWTPVHILPLTVEPLRFQLLPDCVGFFSQFGVFLNHVELYTSSCFLPNHKALISIQTSRKQKRVLGYCLLMFPKIEAQIVLKTHFINSMKRHIRPTWTVHVCICFSFESLGWSLLLHVC